MAVLVTGGAGYIGSVTVEMLRAAGREAVVVDNLVYGHRESLAADVPLYEGNAGDSELISRVINAHGVDSCVHFAAYAYVGESVTDPAKYFENNTVRTNQLLNTLVENGVNHFVFSSTCATYGDPIRIPIDETHPQKPVNPYGWTKFMTERILETYDTAYSLKSVALRYFNAAGASEHCGEHHEPETHLIPKILEAAAGESPHISVFGGDYDTPDGTCIRDYIHITDLGDAHIRALDYLEKGGESTQINLGNGVGFSVFEVIEAARSVTAKEIAVKMEQRRPGDPSHLIADAGKALEVLGWKPNFPTIEKIIKTAWDWKLAHPRGYE